MPDLLCYSGKVSKIRTCFYNVVAYCSEQTLDEQYDFILQNDWELTYLTGFFIIAICFSPKTGSAEPPLLENIEDTLMKTIALCQRNSHNLDQQQREVRKVIKKCIAKINKGLCIS